jgi:hypothetical protein
MDYLVKKNTVFFHIFHDALMSFACPVEFSNEIGDYLIIIGPGH